eukprot:CAMPEP_0201097528 /NCGR_PEP_ID=MMETSP0812-20130820/6602_1 /ASSEMBLY_ACC=CAM_ASM_000668 /TAXON_ID=98059 /ORGANISM="Dinobryon sp., Strain UTEXLB2267" /LENGTH=41 /DNA_ID= /DNA_START= /DNA_END= /DNA_ORIENTATION=
MRVSHMIDPGMMLKLASTFLGNFKKIAPAQNENNVNKATWK